MANNVEAGNSVDASLLQFTNVANLNHRHERISREIPGSTLKPKIIPKFSKNESFIVVSLAERRAVGDGYFAGSVVPFPECGVCGAMISVVARGPNVVTQWSCNRR